MDEGADRKGQHPRFDRATRERKKQEACSEEAVSEEAGNKEACSQEAGNKEACGQEASNEGTDHEEINQVHQIKLASRAQS